MLRGIKLLGASGFVWTVGLWLFATSPLAPSCTRRFPSAWAGARGWVVDTAGHGGGSILQGLGCSPIVELSLGT